MLTENIRDTKNSLKKSNICLILILERQKSGHSRANIQRDNSREFSQVDKRNRS